MGDREQEWVKLRINRGKEKHVEDWRKVELKEGGVERERRVYE